MTSKKNQPGPDGGMATVAVKLQNNTTRDWDRGTYGVPVLFEANIVTFFVLLAQVLRTMDTV